MSGHEFRSELYEVLILLILTMEYFFGRSDTDMKNEAKRKKKFREKYQFETLNQGEGK